MQNCGKGRVALLSNENMAGYKILYVENFADIIGGGQISLLGLLGKLDRGKFIPIVALPQKGRLSEKLRQMQIDFIIVKMPSLRRLNVISFLRGISQFRKLIREERISIVHANGSRVAIYAGIAAKTTGVPLVWHVRIADSDGLLDRFLAGLSTRIIAISDAVNRRFSWMSDRHSKVKTIYNGIDLEKFNPSLNGENIRREFKLESNTPLVGTVGRLDWYKGHKYFLRAARKVADIIPECHFLIVGDGEKRKELEELAKELNLNKCVIFTGEREDIPQILASLDLFVLSSVSEGFGRSAVEAMACAKPVVATDAGGLSEVIKDRETGVLVPAKNIAALAEAIIGLLKNKDKAFKMGIAGRKLVEARFDLSINAEKTQNLYLDLLRSDRKDGRE